MIQTNPLGATGSGPMWLSGLRCDGNEMSLMKCPHDGLHPDVVYDGFYYWGCNTHNYDAYVSCVDKCEYLNGDWRETIPVNVLIK
jgi:hypothetical protein